MLNFLSPQKFDCRIPIETFQLLSPITQRIFLKLCVNADSFNNITKTSIKSLVTKDEYCFISASLEELINKKLLKIINYSYNNQLESINILYTHDGRIIKIVGKSDVVDDYKNTSMKNDKMA